MKYKLITLPRGVRRIPYLQATQASLSLNPNNASPVPTGTSTTPDQVVSISTLYHDMIGNSMTVNPFANTFNSSEGYSVLLMDNTYVFMRNGKNTDLLSASVLYPGQAASSVTAVLRPTAGTGNTVEIVLELTSTATQLTTTANKSTKLIITGVETGGRVVIPITINGIQQNDD
jgi:hypothetical protein